MKKTFDPSEPLHPDPSSIQLSLKELMPSDHIKLTVNALKRHEILGEMATLAMTQGAVSDRDTLLIALAERERMISTAYAGGVAFLHPRRREPALVKKSSIFLGIAPHGIPFEAPDKANTHLFFLLLLKTDLEHLRALSEITRLCRNKENVAVILKAGSVETITNLLPN